MNVFLRIGAFEFSRPKAGRPSTNASSSAEWWPRYLSAEKTQVLTPARTFIRKTRGISPNPA